MYLATLHVGGVVAIGFDPTGRYMLVVSHSGRGVFDTRTWQRVARDSALAYPENGEADGIGPLAGQRLKVSEINYDDGTLQVVSPSGDVAVSYSEGTIDVRSTGT
jgi:hypothetical protein